MQASPQDSRTETSAPDDPPGQRAGVVVAGFLVGLATILGFALRLGAVAKYDFPLNDGGLFFSMVQDLLHNGFSAPASTTYNHAGIPFIYPPIGLYLAAILTGVGLPLLQILRIVPLVLSTLCVPAFYGFARRILASAVPAALASLAFALLPDSFSWRIMGGGITRAPGLLLGLLTLTAVCDLVAQPTRRNAVLSGLLGGATILSHPEAALHIGLGVILLTAMGSQRRKMALMLAAASLIAIAVACVWWIPAIGRHGIGPVVAAFQSREWTPWYVYLYRSVAAVDPISMFLALLGMAVLRGKRLAFLLAYFAGMFILLPRSAPQFAVIVIPILSGAGLAVTLHRLSNVTGSQMADAFRYVPSGRGWLPMGLFVAFIFVPNWGTTVSLPYLQALGPGQREAMQWSAEHTDSEAVFLVIEGKEFYAAADAEWFPALTGRRSGIAVQGYEWLEGDRITERIVAFNELQKCGFQDASCVEDWAREHAVTYTHLFITKPPRAESSDCCSVLADSLDTAAGFSKIFENGEVAIYRVRAPQ